MSLLFAYFLSFTLILPIKQGNTDSTDVARSGFPLLLFTGNIPRGVFCEQSSQKTRELRREIMQSMISVHREARYCERSEQ